MFGLTYRAEYDEKTGLWAVVRWVAVPGTDSRIGVTEAKNLGQEAADSLAQALQWEEEQAIYAEFG